MLIERIVVTSVYEVSQEFCVYQIFYIKRNLLESSYLVVHSFYIQKYMLKIHIPGHSEETEGSQNFKVCLLARGVMYLCCNSSVVGLSSHRQFREILTTGSLLLRPYLGQWHLLCDYLQLKACFLEVAGVFLCSGMNTLLFIPRK